MKRLMLLGLSAAYTGLAMQAGVTAATQAIPAPAYAAYTADEPLKAPPANFDAGLAGSREAEQRLTGRSAARISAPWVGAGSQQRRLRPAPIVTDHYDTRLGRPTLVWAGKDAGQSVEFLAHRQSADATGFARAYLHEFADRLEIVPAMIDDAELVFLHDDDEGAVIARFQQRVNGLPVMNRQLNVVMSQDLALIAISGWFAGAKSALKRDFGDAFRAGPTAAMNTAFADLGLPVSAYDLYDTGKARGGFARFAPPSGVAAAGVELAAPVGVKKVLFALGDDLVPGWLLTVQAGQAATPGSLAYGYVVSADGRRVLFRKNLVAQDSYRYRVFADAGTLQPDDSPFGNGLVPHPTGNPADPVTREFGAGTLVTVPTASQGIADAWLPMPDVGLPVDGTITQGNNVWAYADVAGGDGQDSVLDVYGQITALGEFDHVADFSLQPGDLTNQQAAIVNLFYLNNWLHDAWYNAGFTESVGNAQVSNYSSGGAELDPILAEAQDFSGRNNANMLVPPDGFSPRMQMFIFDNGQVEIQRVEIVAPAAIAQVLEPTGGAGFGPAEYATFSGSVVVYNDGSTADGAGGTTGTVTDGCQAAVNGGALAGHIALIDRGTCNFTVKAANAQAAGAIATLIVNNEPGDIVVDMNGTDPAIAIPSLMISNVDGGIIRNELTAGGGTVTVEMERAVASDRDSAFDSQVVAHEFFHYVSNRLVGDAFGLFNVQGGGMGEGWSDMAGLLLTVRDADLANAPDGAYSVGGYDTDDFYQAARRFPYSTDMTRNPLTFADIAVFPEVHAVGEIWAVALWEAYVGLYNHYETVNPATAFTEARTRMMGYLIEGLMATPNVPTMIEARDAILAVVRAADATDYAIFVAAFAKRGMGFGAIAPPRESLDLIGVVQSFETDLKTFVVQDAAFAIAAAGCDADFSLDPGETGEVTISVLNTGSADLPGVMAELSSPSDITFPNGGALPFAPDPLPMFGGIATATGTGVMNATASSGMTHIDVGFPDLGATADDVTEPAAVQLPFPANEDYVPARFADDVETVAASLSDWTRTRTGTGADWTVDSGLSILLGGRPPFNDYWYGVDNDSAGTTELVTPRIVVGGAPLSLGFHHYFQFEADFFFAYDGGVLEINIDDTGWQDVLAAGGTFAVGYNGTISVTNFGNPLQGRQAFVRSGGGGPESIGFGSALAGRTVQFRFRTASDVAVGELGWIVDDVTVAGAATPMFSSVVAENGVCGDAAPVADAGPNQDVAAGATVTLDGSASSDDGVLSYAWTQVGGATVALSDAATAQPTFVADTASYTFLLTVTDDKGQVAADSVTVNVTGSGPVADAGTDQDVAPGITVILDGSRSAASDFTTLSYAWTQVGGTGVALSDAAAVQPTFTAPFGAASYTFELTVTDGQSRTASDSVTVNVTDAAPVADAGPDQTVAAGKQVTLGGSGSSDPEGDITYAWTQTAGDSVTLSDPAAAHPSFTAPFGDGIYTFQLTVTDQGAQTASDTVTVTVQDEPPIADAGGDRSVQGFARVSLDGSGSSDAEGAITYAWTQTAGDSVALSDPASPRPSFMAPNADVTLTFDLTVTDEAGATDTDSVSVTVTRRADPPQSGGNGDDGDSGGGSTGLWLLGGLLGLLLRRGRRR